MGHKRRRRLDHDVPPAALPPSPPATRLGLAVRHQLTAGGTFVHGAGFTGSSPASERAALGVDTVFACVRIIADAVAGGDVGEWRGTLRLPASRIVHRPMASMTRREWLWLVTATLALYNVALLERIGPRDSEGVIGSLRPVSPDRITWQPSAPLSGIPSRPMMLVDGATPDPERFAELRRARFPVVEGQAAYALTLARALIETAAASDAYAASYWSEGGAPITILSTDQVLNADEADAYADRWIERRALGPQVPAVLSAGLKATPFGADLGTEAAASASADIDAAIARTFGVPVHLVAAERSGGSSLTYSNVETEGLHLARYTVSAYSATIADAISDELPGDWDGGRECRIGLAHLTTPEMGARFAAWASAIEAGWLTVDEVREREGYGPLELAPARAEQEVRP